MKHINSKNIEKCNCCGCSACQQICPHNCISMNIDAEGFLYPKVNEMQCIDCGICSTVCPWIKNEKKEEKVLFPIVYAAKHKDDEVRRKSTSGGIFTLFATKVLQSGGYVYGATFLSEFQYVGHVGVCSEKYLDLLRGSKYVQSRQGNVFREIRDKLKSGVHVLYTGTPCQCQGLRSYLRRDYENLFIIDILCHSVPSPRVFDDLMDSYGGKIDSISFRDKSRGWRNSYQLKLIRNKEVYINDSFLTLFFKGLINRPSCYNCKFTNIKRSGDITVGDYWNIKAIVPSFEDALGVSCLLVNTEKGRLLFDEVSSSLDYIKTDLEPAIQTCMKRHVTLPKSRIKFWEEYNKYGFSYCEKKYGTMSVWERFRDRYLAPFVRKLGISALLRKLR